MINLESCFVNNLISTIDCFRTEFNQFWIYFKTFTSHWHSHGMDFFIAILVLALVLYRNKTIHDTLLNPDPRMEQKTRKFYGGLVGVALFVLVIAVIIITIWDLFFNY
jgi:hypothetical protein